MSTITTLQNTDSGSDSMGIINDNFDALNSDKIESDSTDTLQNKTIDGDNNSISNIATSSLKNKTGLDTDIVTGTAGSANELAKWNSDGDIVTTGITVETSLTSSNTKVPTSKAVKDYVDAAIATKSVFVTNSNTDGTASIIDNYAYVSLNNLQYAMYKFIIPEDFTSFLSLEAIMIPDATETIQWDIAASQAASAETYNTITATDLNVTSSVTVNKLTVVDIGASTNINSLLTGLSSGDMLGITFTSNTTLLRILGLKLKYN